MVDTAPIRLSRTAKFAMDELKRKHARRMRRDFTLSQIVEAADLVAEMYPEAMDSALAAIVSGESGRTHDGTSDG